MKNKGKTQLENEWKTNRKTKEKKCVFPIDCSISHLSNKLLFNDCFTKSDGMFFSSVKGKTDLYTESFFKYLALCPNTEETKSSIA